MPFVSRTPRQSLFLVLLVLVPGLQGCDWSKKPTPFPSPTSMSRTVTQALEGVIVTMHVLNADAHRVVLDLTLEGPARPYGYQLETTWIYEPQMPGPALTAGDEKLPFLPQAGADMISVAGTRDGLPLSRHGIIAFDTSDLHWDQSRIPLHLSLPLLVNNKPPVIPLPVPTGTIPATSTPTQVPPASHVLLFDFTFDVAYDARQVVLEPRQEVENNGVKMTLEKVDVTTSEARVSVRYSSTTPDNSIYQGDWVSYSELEVDEVVGPEGYKTNFKLVGEPDGCYKSSNGNQCVFSYVDRALSLIDRAPVDSTLTVTVGQNAPMHVQGFSPPTSKGVFHFTLPTASTER